MSSFFPTLHNLIPSNSLEEYFSSKKISIDSESFENLRSLEVNFYENIMHAIKTFISNAENQPVILFDIDDTILCRDINNEVDYFRPSFLYIIAQINKEFPNMLLGILSQRRNWPPSAVKNLFEERFIVCSHWFDQINVEDESYAFTDWSDRPIYIEKVNAFLDICNRYSDYSFFLIDDILSNDRKTGQNPLVSKWLWYAVKKNEKFLPEYHIIWIAI